MNGLDRSEIVGVVLAGGRSQRMGGGDKGLRDLGGRPMLAHVIARFAPQVGRVVINANGDPSRFARFGLPVVADSFPDFPGPLAGVLAGMRYASTRAVPSTHIATVSGDAPFLPSDLVVRLAQASASSGDAIAMAQSADVLHAVIALWPVALADALEAALAAGERGVRRWAERQGMMAVTFEPLHVAGRTVDPFFNVNTPEEFLEAGTLMQLIGQPVQAP